jgi:tetratricopeptide repeat protein 30
MAFSAIKQGKFTSTIYGMIRDARFHEVVALLKSEVVSYPKSRAAWSLLGYAYYQLQDFHEAAGWYATRRACLALANNAHCYNIS